MNIHDKDGRRKRVAVNIYAPKEMPDGSHELAAVIHCRGAYDFEKGCPEEHPYLSQSSAHGKLDGDESLMRALKREITEEIGGRFCKKAWPLMKFYKVYEEVKHDRRTITYATFIPYEPLKLLQLWSGSAGFFFVTRKEFEQKAIGMCRPDTIKTSDMIVDNIYMIVDEIVGVINGFELFRNRVIRRAKNRSRKIKRRSKKLK